MLRIPNLEELKSLLLEVPSLVDGLESRDPAAVGRVRNWLSAVEKALSNNRMTGAATIAGLRAQSVLAERGVLGEGFAVHGRITPPKIREVTAAAVVRAAAGLVSGAIEPDLLRVDEADRIARQLAIAAQVRGILSATRPAGDVSGEILDGWARVLADPEVGQGAVHLVSIVGPEDAVLVFDRAVTRDVWVGAATASVRA